MRFSTSLPTAFVFLRSCSFLNYRQSRRRPGMEAAPADGTDTARRGTRLFNTHCAWQWTTTRLCTWRAWAGHTGTDTTAHDNTRCNPPPDWGGPASPHATSIPSGEFRTRGHVPRTHKLICTRAMGRGCVTRGDTAELAARPHNNNIGNNNKAFAA